MGASPLLAVAEIVLTALAEVASSGTTRDASSTNDEIVSLELVKGVTKGTLDLIIKAASSKEILSICPTKENVSFSRKSLWNYSFN